MGMDIEANNYPFQCLLCFLTLKLHPTFLFITQKLYFEPQLFTRQKNISYKETLDNILLQNKVLHPNTGEMKLT